MSNNLMHVDDIHLLIDEEIYLLQEDRASIPEPTEKKVEEKQPEKSEPIPSATPTIPNISNAEATEFTIPFAVFHQTANQEELLLLKKIIEACKIPETDLKIFANGFDKEVRFKKALVFTEKAKSFYTKVPYEGGTLICSKTLQFLSTDNQEKRKLWETLIGFVQESN